MNGRLSFAELADWVEGRLSPERAEQVSERVATDDDAARTADWIADFLRTTRAMPLVAPPPEVHHRLLALFGDRAHGDGRIDADLLYDTAVAAVGGVRFDPGSDERHLAFETPHGRFVVEIRPAGEPGAVDVRGLVLFEGEDRSGAVTLLESDVVRARASVDADGAFEVGTLPASVDMMHLDVGPWSVRARLDVMD